VVLTDDIAGLEGTAACPFDNVADGLFLVRGDAAFFGSQRLALTNSRSA
jgi:hypothetical protein